MARRRVLVAVDEHEDRARAQARTVATLFDPDAAEVVVHHDFTDNPEGAYIDQIGSVRRAREAFEADGFDVTLHETSGDPATAIVDAAAEVDADTICIYGRRRSPAGKALFGSVAQSVILTADRPVIVAPERADEKGDAA
ncbi:universal stress protein [Halegenticoccus soli]|uniref:universal stress protein n=1 Tax=Halegenticoccus soli TaxID=1985678 RepID=UPI000C6D8A6E|nr:universal stress protein [Halegenticoccus soli]